MGRIALGTAALGIVLALARPALALDKQGASHGGSDGEKKENLFDIDGALSLGTAIHNPSYAARPDNTGIALFRYALHLDVDVIGPKLSFPIDLNMFTDRTKKGAGIFSPTEFDFIGGVTSTWPLGAGSLELGTRFEHDRPLDTPATFTQTYIDTRARYLYSLSKVFPSIGPALADGDVSGWITLGWFAYNPTYAARPDNTGRALFRYAPHIEISLFDDLISYGIDATMFTDRKGNGVKPTELDLTQEVILHLKHYELHLAYERDLPLDTSGLTQAFVYALAVFNFSLVKDKTAPLETRGQVLSP